MDMKHLIKKSNNNLNSANAKLPHSESISRDLTVNHVDTGIEKMNPKQRQKRLIKLKKDMEKKHNNY